jgi:O-acetyl-ADP-ribose deacetylase (regulator of RNase III)
MHTETVTSYAWWGALLILSLLAGIYVGWKIIGFVHERGITARITQARPVGMRIVLLVGDITTQEVDAIVNAAKPSLLGGGGVDGAIHRAGGPAILAECREIRATLYPRGLPTGQAVSTTGGNLKAAHVIHTVGPVYGWPKDDAEDQRSTLRSCYTESLAQADTLGARTVAFPLISAGVYGWPKDDAVRQALTVLTRAQTAVQEVRMVFFDDDTYQIAKRVALTLTTQQS